ncbi:MAG TPA: carbonic anhydrase [Blastocatellia bacterium]|nr:carbonic anhydrase [Blastocatellia bacterium]
MRKQIRSLLGGRARLLAAALLVVMLSTAFAADKPGVPPDEAMVRLKAGNVRFVKSNRKPVNYVAERAALVKDQHPYAILLVCSDSRVPPELVFDESLGRLFIVRVAGNVVDTVALGSIEYGVDILGARLLVVLGHQSCGAVKETLKGGQFPPNIAAIVRKIQPAADRAKERGLGPEATLKLAIEENVRQQIHDALAGSEILRDRVGRVERDGKARLTITGGVYDLASGKVVWQMADAAVASK